MFENKYFPEKPINKTILNEMKKIITLLDFKKKLWEKKFLLIILKFLFKNRNKVKSNNVFKKFIVY